MSARRPLVTVCRSAGLSITWPMARMSAVVSVMITSITMNIEMIAPTAKVGRPKWNGRVSWKMLASAIRLKLVNPNGIATTVPSTRPSRIATRPKAAGQEAVDQHDDHHGDGGDRDVLRRAEVGVPGAPPPAQRMATGSSEIPMTVMTTPGHHLGKEAQQPGEDRRDQQGRARPATSRAPKTARRPATPPSSVTDRQDGRHGGERGALHDRLPGAELPHPDGLQQRGEAGDEQAGRDQVGDLGTAELERGADDQRHGDDTGVHAQHVLQPVRRTSAGSGST